MGTGRALLFSKTETCTNLQTSSVCESPWFSPAGAPEASPVPESSKKPCVMEHALAIVWYIFLLEYSASEGVQKILIQKYVNSVIL